MSQEVIVAVEAALQAGKILRERTDDIGIISFKGFHDPVTEVDHLAEKAVITRIKKTFPTTIFSRKNQVIQREMIHLASGLLIHWMER